MEESNRRAKSAEKQAIYYRNYRRCRDRALRRLAHENPNRYRELLEEEKAKDETEGKAWLDLSGRTKRSLDSASSPNRRSKVPVRKAHRNRFKTSNKRRKK